MYRRYYTRRRANAKTIPKSKKTFAQGVVAVAGFRTVV